MRTGHDFSHEGMFQSLADNLPQLVWMTDPAGNALWYNRRWYEYTGTTFAEMEGWGWRHIHHPDHFLRVAERFRISLESGEPWEDIFPLRGRDGEFRWFLSRAMPIRDASGKIIRWFGSNTDITEQRHVEQELRESRARLQFLIDNSPDNIFIQDRDLRYVWVAKPTPGLTFREILGRNDIELFNDAETARYLTVVKRRVIDQEQTEHVEAPMKIGDFSGYAEAIFQPWRDEAGKVIGLLGYVRDITVRKQQEDRLRESDRRKDEFLAVLSHELRNPLTPIRNSLHLLAKTPPGSEKAIRAQQTIERQVDHLSHLVDDLLDVTRITRGKIQLDREVLDLNSLVAKTIEDHRPGFERAGVALSFLPSPELERVNGDPVRLAQVIDNLLSNALKFTQGMPGGEVHVAVAHSGGMASVRVHDTGTGIGGDILPHVFEPFTQAERTLARSSGGLGLGLALVKGLVDLHGGQVEVASAGLGRGSTFTFHLPLVPAAAEVAGAGNEKATAETHHRVLVIEDNHDAAESLVEVLELEGHQAVMAHTGHEGVAKFHSFRPDVVLCDVGLPDINGFEVAKTIRANQIHGQVRLVALTGYALPSDIEKSKAAGFDLHLAKPVKVDDVLAALHA